MTKHYCDRCGRESEELVEVRIPTVKHEFGTFRAEGKEVCPDCVKIYCEIIDKLADIRFILFRDFMPERSEGK